MILAIVHCSLSFLAEARLGTTRLQSLCSGVAIDDFLTVFLLETLFSQVTPPSHSHAGSSDSLPFPTSSGPPPPPSSTSQQPPEAVALPKPGRVNRVKLDSLQAKKVC